MRRLLPFLLGLALFAAACADDVDAETADDPSSSVTAAPTTATPSSAPPTTPSTSTLPPPSSTVVSPTVPTTTTESVLWPGVVVDASALPSVVIADGTAVTAYRPRPDGTLDQTRLQTADHPITHLHQSSEGYLFTREWSGVAEDEGEIEFVRYHFDAGREVLDVDWIFDVAVVGGIESVIVAVASPDGFGFGGVEAWAVDDLRFVADLGLSAEAEFGVTDFHWSDAAGLGVASAWSDLTEWVGFVDAEGEPVALPSPTADLDYNAPPYVTAATISTDGSTLYWAEGPDWGFDPETAESGPIADSWVLHGADLVSGETILVWPLSEPVLDSTILDVHSILPLGDFIVINRTTVRGTESVALAPLVLDFTVEEPELYEYPVAGIATPWAI